MDYSAKCYLKDNIEIAPRGSRWQKVVQLQPSLWRKGEKKLDLSFLPPEPYTFVVDDSGYDVALVKEALAKIILYLNDRGISTTDLAVRIEGKADVQADEYRKVLGSWVYGSLKIDSGNEKRKRLLVAQCGLNPKIQHDLAVFVVPNGNGEIQLLTDDRNLANKEYDAQCGSDIPISDLVVAYDSAMKDAAPFGSKERTAHMVKKLKQLLTPGGHAVLLCEEGAFGVYENVIVAPKDGYKAAMEEIEREVPEAFPQVTLIYDLAYTKIRNVLV